jgi:Zinc knuckle
MVKDEIAKDPPKTLRQFIVMATRIDNRQFERRSETSNQNIVPKATTTATTESKPRPKSTMDEGWPDATEKARRQANGLCYYCGDLGHTRSNCPRLAQKNSTDPAAATVSSIMLGPISYPPQRDKNFAVRETTSSETSP